MIMSADHPGLTFSLRLIRSEPTYNQPVQQWSFVSDFAVSDSGSYLIFLFCCLGRHLRCLNEKHERPPFSFKVRDYSGTYTVKLLPCTTPSHQEYRLPVTCNPREPITFDLDIRFQQVRLLHLFSHDFSNPTLWRSWLTCIGKKKKFTPWL